MTTALVLGGGGVTGIGWELGILLGLADAGVDVTDADIIVGTSAGSVVGAVAASGHPLSEMYDEQLGPPDTEIGGEMTRAILARMVVPHLLPGSQVSKLRRLGRGAQRAHPDGGQDRVDVIASRLPDHEWPDRDLRITAVDARSGQPVWFTRDSQVELVRAVAASCAVPFVWPTVSIHGRPYMDGGMRSTTNVDLARNADRVVVIAPIPQAFSRDLSIRNQLARIGARHSAVIVPDAESVAAIGKNMLDPRRRADAARAGRRQAAEMMEKVATAWQASDARAGR